RHTRSKRDWSSDVCSSDLFALKNFIAQRTAPEIAHGIVDIVGIADTGDDSFRAVCEDVGVGVEFVRFAPRGDGGMLGCRDAVGRSEERRVGKECGGGGLW